MKTSRGSLRRRQSQGGQELVEFALVTLMFIPLFVGSFVTGMSTVRAIQVNHVTRDLASMYMHGADFSDRGMQSVSQRLAKGLGLEIGTGTGNIADNLANGGRGIVWISKVMWVGSTLEPTCQTALPASCANAAKFVFLERVRFGNGTLESERSSSLGQPSAATRNEYGVVTNNLALDSRTQVPEPYQSQLQAIWQTSNNGTGQRPLTDGQILYVAEMYFQTPDLSLGSIAGKGVYARWFF